MSFHLLNHFLVKGVHVKLIKLDFCDQRLHACVKFDVLQHFVQAVLITLNQHQVEAFLG